MAKYQADQFTDVKFMSAQDKARVATMFERFLADNMHRDKFTKALYEHFHLHCGHIAHYDRGGFYSEWFERPSSRVEFLRRLADDHESGRLYWGAGEDYRDLGTVMYGLVAAHADRIFTLAKAAHEANLTEHRARIDAQLEAL